MTSRPMLTWIFNKLPGKRLRLETGGRQFIQVFFFFLINCETSYVVDK